MGKRISIVQSNYLPWKGYFDLIRHSDTFVFLDSVAYTKRNWRNRNSIKTPNGLKWLTVPVTFHFTNPTSIEKVRIADQNWASDHLVQIVENYRKAPFFDDTISWLEPLMLAASEKEFLSEVNHFLIKAITEKLGVETSFTTSSELIAVKQVGKLSGNNELLVGLTKAAGGDICVNGPTGKAYTDENYCKDHGVSVRWVDYGGYPVYPQLHGPFRHDVSIVDMFMMLGPDTKFYLKEEGFV